jgi:hypothetical protein
MCDRRSQSHGRPSKPIGAVVTRPIATRVVRSEDSIGGAKCLLMGQVRKDTMSSDSVRLPPEIDRMSNGAEGLTRIGVKDPQQLNT